jgi:nitrous oxidase accessory protein NosD
MGNAYLERAGRVMFAAMVSLLVTLRVAGLAQAQTITGDAVSACGDSIKACGCTITAPGFYDLAKALSDIKLNSDSSCIAIKSSNVVLSLDDKNIIGSGVGIGIHVLSSASNSFIEGLLGTSVSAVTGWDTGILVEGNYAVIQNVTTQGNATVGLEIHAAKYATVSGLASSSNPNGVWLNDAGFSQISNSSTSGISNNMGPGILIGCPVGCPKSAISNHNRIFANTVSTNQTGIVIVAGSQQNVITDNAVSGSTKGDDLMDSNDNCGSDIWFGNTMFLTAEPATCVH